MAELQEYLRISLAGTDFLLPANASFAIEQHDSMHLNEHGPVAAWWESNGVRCPVYHVDSELKLAHSDDWQHVVFLNARPQPVGLAVNDIQTIAASEIQVEAFQPLGKPPTAAGHLFSAAWIQGPEAMLIFEPRALAALLLSLGGGA